MFWDSIVVDRFACASVMGLTDTHVMGRILTSTVTFTSYIRWKECHNHDWRGFIGIGTSFKC